MLKWMLYHVLMMLSTAVPTQLDVLLLLQVVELVVVRDKFTHESKGSAFIWYQNRQQADHAILQFNVRHVLPDPTGEQDRPLVVRRANSRKAAGAGTGLPPGMGDVGAAAGGAMLMAPPGSEIPVHVHPMMAPQVRGMAGCTLR